MSPRRPSSFRYASAAVANRNPPQRQTTFRSSGVTRRTTKARRVADGPGAYSREPQPSGAVVGWKPGAAGRPVESQGSGPRTSPAIWSRTSSVCVGSRRSAPA